MNDREGPRDCCFDEWAAHAVRRARSKEVSTKITGALVDALESQGLAGRTLLDVGCGSGDLALAVIARGADRATGYDLGPGAIQAARALAEERGLTERTTFAVGDGASIVLPRADVVSLNRVLCCYPHVDELLSNTLEAAGSIFGFTAPRDRGVIGLGNRISIWFGNGWYRLRVKKFAGFRAFVHDLNAVDERIRAAGFEPVRREHRRSWDLAVYVRL